MADDIVPQCTRAAAALGFSGVVVVIDEIQRRPDLLTEVHRMIEQRGTRFVVTGSGARTLRRGGVSLLGGRAREVHLHPLTWYELGEVFDLQTVWARGTLPSICFSDDPGADLEAYAGLSLQQDVPAEGATCRRSADS